jgi:GT2 family glycosyltransferase
MISYSIVISTYNQVGTLRLALESLRRQIKNPKAFEIIIADDSSTDGTNEFVRKLRYPIFLKYIRSDTNQGRARNRNRGFQKAAGEWIIFIDGDMLPEPDFIESYLRAWDESPEVITLGSWKLPKEWKENRYQTYLATRGRMTMKHGEKVPGKYFTSGNFAIRKNLLERLGGFDISFEGWGGEDTDFGLKLESDSIPIYYIPKASCYHYHKKSLDDTIGEYEKFGMEGFPLLANKYPDEIIFEKGWLLGLPGPDKTIMQRFISLLLFPLRSSLSLALLNRLAKINSGALFSDSLFDWLFYGYLARGYRRRPK